jgi:hypothetical protein
VVQTEVVAQQVGQERDVDTGVDAVVLDVPSAEVGGAAGVAVGCDLGQ